MAPDRPPPTSRAEQFRRWKAIRERPGNNRCADCDATDTSWAVLDYGILICVRCAGSHRALGSHISKVRSTQLDQFTEDEFEWIESLGNAKSNALWEAALPVSMRRPAAEGPDCIRRMWLRQKYDEQRFTAGTEHRGLPEHESHCGWLHKQGSLVPTWKKRYFCIHGGRLLYFSSHVDTPEEGAPSMRGSLPLVRTTIELDEDGRTFRLGPDDSGARGSSGSVLVARAADSDEAEQWVWALYQCAAAAARMSPSAAAPPQRRGGSLFGGGGRRSLFTGGTIAPVHVCGEQGTV